MALLTLLDDLTGSGNLTGSAVQSADLAFGLWANYGLERGAGGARFNSYGGASNSATSTGPCPSSPLRYLLEVGLSYHTDPVYPSAQLGVNDTSISAALGPRMVHTDTGVEYHMQGASPTLLFKDTTNYGNGTVVVRKLDIDAVGLGYKCYADGTLLDSGTFSGSAIPVALGTIFVQLGIDRYGGPDPTNARLRDLRATLNEEDGPTPPAAPFWTDFVFAYEDV